MSRKDYWNDSYYKYWKSRVDEAQQSANTSEIVKGDALTVSDDVYLHLFRDVPPQPGSLLEVGCAWGRMFGLYMALGLDIHGLDISSAMIARAKEAYASDPKVKKLLEGEAESLPFPDAAFDNVSCLATFDATFQHLALKEFFRVLRTGGRLYLTGKNTRYFKDDVLALEAEEAARKKEHPNYFTDVDYMLEEIAATGYTVVASYYFLRRGDFSRNNSVSRKPVNFYEWILVIDKTAATPPGVDERLASTHSVTFRGTEGATGVSNP